MGLGPAASGNYSTVNRYFRVCSQDVTQKPALFAILSTFTEKVWCYTLSSHYHVDRSVAPSFESLDLIKWLEGKDNNCERELLNSLFVSIVFETNMFSLSIHRQGFCGTQSISFCGICMVRSVRPQKRRWLLRPQPLSLTYSMDPLLKMKHNNT